MSTRKLDQQKSGLTAVNDALTLSAGDLNGVTEIGVYVEFDHTSAAGTILVETASVDDYTGTWATLATISWAAIDKAHYAALTNALRALRVRVSSTVTSGTAKVTVVGN